MTDQKSLNSYCALISIGDSSLMAYVDAHTAKKASEKAVKNLPKDMKYTVRGDIVFVQIWSLDMSHDSFMGKPLYSSTIRLDSDGNLL